MARSASQQCFLCILHIVMIPHAYRRQLKGEEESMSAITTGESQDSIYSTVGSRPLLNTVTYEETSSDESQQPSSTSSSVKDTSALQVASFKVPHYLPCKASHCILQFLSFWHEVLTDLAKFSC